MPEIFRFYGFSFFFYSKEHEPLHVHVEGNGGMAIFLLGVIIGFTFAPIKKGIKIGCNNGNNCTDSGKITNPFCKNTKQEENNDEEEECCGNFCAD